MCYQINSLYAKNSYIDIWQYINAYVKCFLILYSIHTIQYVKLAKLLSAGQALTKPEA